MMRRSTRLPRYFRRNQLRDHSDMEESAPRPLEAAPAAVDSSEPSGSCASDAQKPAAYSSAPQQPQEEGSSYVRFQALERVGKDAKQHWTSLPSNWQTDREFILRALTKSPTLPPKSNFERAFPQWLRFDREVVLAFCQRSDFEILYEERHLFVPGCLTSDKEVMMAYCQRIPRSLQECTEDLCNDPEVVQAAISLGGLELQYASLRLQEDPHIVQQACQSHGRALEYCPPGPTRDALTSNKAFMRDVVLAKAGGGPMWKLATPELQQDPELLLQALKHGLCLRDVPDPFGGDLNFLQRALQINALLYLQLLPSMQAKTCLARQAITSEDSTPEIHSKALGHCPSLKSERHVVLSLCQRGNVDSLSELLGLPTSEPFIDDIEIMKVAIERDSNLLSIASPRLQVSPQLILVSITPTSAWNTLKTISSTIIRQNPEIPIRAVQKSVTRNLRYLPGHIPDDIWAGSRELCLAWLQRGGRVLEAFEPLLVVQPPYTEEDLELPLAVAKYNWSETYKVGDALLRNREFLLRALAMDGRILRFAPLPLRQEFDIQVMAVANHNNNMGGNNSHTMSVASSLGGSIDIPRLQTQIREKLQLHKTFCQEVLGGIAIARPHLPPQRRSQLPMLDRGVETSQAFKRLIAEYLGVPLGQPLAMLRRAQANLAMPNNSASASSCRARSNAPTAAARDFRLPEDVEGRIIVEQDHPDPHHAFWFGGGRNNIEPLLHPPHHPQQRDAFVPPGAVARRQRHRVRQRMAFERMAAHRDEQLAARMLQRNPPFHPRREPEPAIALAAEPPAERVERFQAFAALRAAAGRDVDEDDNDDEDDESSGVSDRAFFEEAQMLDPDLIMDLQL